MSQWLPYLFILACPLGMGLMMWMMMRGQSMDRDQQQPPDRDPRIAELESQVNELKAALRDRDLEGTRKR